MCSLVCNLLFFTYRTAEPKVGRLLNVRAWQTLMDGGCPDLKRQEAFERLMESPNFDEDQRAAVDRISLSYILLVHKGRQPWRTILCALADRRDVVVIHVDRRAPEELRREISREASHHDNIHLLPLRDSFASRFFAPALMSAERACLGWLVAERLAGRISKWDYNILVTGADYPVRPRKDLVEFLWRLKHPYGSPPREVGGAGAGAEGLGGGGGISNLINMWEPTDIYPDLAPSQSGRTVDVYAVPDAGGRVQRTGLSRGVPQMFRSFCLNTHWRIIDFDTSEWLIFSPVALQFFTFFQSTTGAEEMWIGNSVLHSPFVNRTANRNVWSVFWGGNNGRDRDLPWMGHPYVLPVTGSTVEDTMERLRKEVADETTMSIFFARKFQVPLRKETKSTGVDHSKKDLLDSVADTWSGLRTKVAEAAQELNPDAIIRPQSDSDVLLKRIRDAFLGLDEETMGKAEMGAGTPRGGLCRRGDN